MADSDSHILTVFIAVSGALPNSPTVSADLAHFCNLRTAAHSYQQIIFNSPEELQTIVNELSAFLSCL